jgi:GGDEF domain-containing protein
MNDAMNSSTAERLQQALDRYWQTNLRIMAALLFLWAFASFGCAILWADWLNQFLCDLVGRIGGEEFALILPDTSLGGATMLAERLRQLTENEVVTFVGTHIQFTVSLGVAQYGPDGDTYESVIDTADSRMYRAKQEGRNRVTAR